MPVRVGERAPEFELRNQHRERVRLSQFRGQRNVVLVFYPWAFTSVCTGELREIGDNLAWLQNDRTQVLAVSCDPAPSLRAVADTHRLDFPLLSDFWPHGAVATAYGVFEPTAGAARRGTFIMDTAGVVRWTVDNAIADARELAAYEQALAGL